MGCCQELGVWWGWEEVGTVGVFGVGGSSSVWAVSHSVLVVRLAIVSLAGWKLGGGCRNSLHD